MSPPTNNWREGVQWRTEISSNSSRDTSFTGLKIHSLFAMESMFARWLNACPWIVWLLEHSISMGSWLINDYIHCNEFPGRYCTFWIHFEIIAIYLKLKQEDANLHATKVEITWRRNAILWWCDIYKCINIDAFVSEVEPTHLLMMFSNVRLLQKFIYQHWYLPSIYIYIYLPYKACTILIDL